MPVGRLVACLVAATLAVQVAIRAQAPRPDEGCRFPPAEIAWLQRALDGWDEAARTYLRINPQPLPWIVLFDGSCSWHLFADVPGAAGSRPVESALTFAGQSVSVRALAHDGAVPLPTGISAPVEMKASTSLFRNSRAAFVTMAMPSVWKTQSMSAPTRAEYLRGVFVHELTHARLLPAVNRRVRELMRTNDLVYPINDDVIQAEFGRTPGFEAAINRERDVLYRAALEPDVAKRRVMAAHALDLARARRARYFSGKSTAYGELESLFLTLEGVGQWTAFRLIRAGAAANDSEALRLVRDNRRYWSQDQGLALFLVIDALLPNWQARVFEAASTPPSPYELLAQALQ